MNNQIKRILITSAGGTDPYTLTEGVSEYNDGSILSIIRQKEFDQEPITDVYIYLSLEMAIREARNQVFTKSIHSINQNINIEIFPQGVLKEIENLIQDKKITQNVIEEEKQKEIQKAKEKNPNFNEEIVKRNLNDDKIIFNMIKNDVNVAIVNANKFGIFYPAFYEMIEHIKINYKGKPEIFINVSSGTPAMEMDLDLIAITSNEIKAKIVQVSTPTGSSNVRGNKGYATASDEQLEALNTSEKKRRENPEYKDRVSYENMAKTRKLILLESLEDSFAKYDYAGVYNAVMDNIGIINENSLIVKYATNLYYRYIGDDKKARDKNIFTPDDNGNKIELKELYPIFDDGDIRVLNILKARGLIERINIMNIKAQRNEINDWLLIAQTVVESIYKKLIYCECDSLNIEKIINNDAKSDKYGKIDLAIFNTLNRNKRYEKLLKTVEKSDGDYINAFFLKNILIKWLKGKKSNTELENDITILDKIRNSRNTAAHTEEFITIEELNRNFSKAIDAENNYRKKEENNIRKLPPILLTKEEKENAIEQTNKIINKMMNKILSNTYKGKLDQALMVYEHLKNKILYLLREEIKSQK